MTGPTPFLVFWKSVGLYAWVLHRPLGLARAWLRRPELVPHQIIVYTRSPATTMTVERVLHSLAARPTFLGVRRVEPIAPSRRRASKDGEHAARARQGASAWRVTTARGAEVAVLRQFRFAVALALARTHGYERLDWRMALALSEDLVLAHQSRRLRPAFSTTGVGPIEFGKFHATYKAWICNGPDPEFGVEVAVLDTPFVPGHMPAEIDASRVTNHVDVDDPEIPAPGGHGGAMAAIVASVAPNAHVTVYPVLGYREWDADESNLLFQLMTIAELENRPDVVLISLEAPKSLWGKRRYRMDRRCIDKQLRLATSTTVLVSSGNGTAADDEIAFPAICESVIAVGAVTGDRRIASYTRWRRTDLARGPEMFALAPGGEARTGEHADHALTVAGEGMVGTSVAAAYAAGLVARIVGQVEPSARSSHTSVHATLAATADQALASLSIDTIGLVRQSAPEGATA